MLAQSLSSCSTLIRFTGLRIRKRHCAETQYDHDYIARIGRFQEKVKELGHKGLVYTSQLNMFFTYYLLARRTSTVHNALPFMVSQCCCCVFSLFTRTGLRTCDQSPSYLVGISCASPQQLLIFIPVPI